MRETFVVLLDMTTMTETAETDPVCMTVAPGGYGSRAARLTLIR